MLGVLQVLSTGPLGTQAHVHVSLLLFLLWALYLYRDVWPLATVNLKPVDGDEGALLWAKLALLSLTGFIVPTIIPRKYVPVNPQVRGELLVLRLLS